VPEEFLRIVLRIADEDSTARVLILPILRSTSMSGPHFSQNRREMGHPHHQVQDVEVIWRPCLTA